MDKGVLRLIRAVVGILIIIVLFYKIGVKEIIDVLRQTRPVYLLIVLLLYFITLIIGTFNIHVLLKPIGYRIRFFRLFRHYLVSWSIGLFVPGKIGEFSIVYLLKKEGVSTGKGSAVSLLDKFVTLLTLLVLAAIGMFRFMNNRSSFYLISLALIILIVLFVIIFNERLRAFVRKRLLKRHAGFFDGFSITLKGYLKKNYWGLSLNLLLTMLKWVVSGSMIQLMFFALGMTAVSLANVILITSMITITTLIPISVSGLGVREASSVFLFSILGVAPAITLSMSIIIAAIGYLIAGVIMTFFMDAFREK